MKIVSMGPHFFSVTLYKSIMATFKEFIKLTEAGAGLPGSGSTGTALQRNRPGSQNMFSPTVTYGNTIKDKE